jgi:hypothetical protein
MEGCSQRGNELPGVIKRGEFIDCLKGFELLKNDSAAVS